MALIDPPAEMAGKVGTSLQAVVQKTSRHGGVHS
jgi:hypothetical protein